MATKETKTTYGVIYMVSELVAKTKNPFNCIMIYQDVESRFCFIKPLLLKMDLEIVMELFRIFTSYGPPTEVHVHSCAYQMVVNIDQYMKVLCPSFDIKFTMASSGYNDIPTLVIKKLHEWMDLTQKEQWEIGCCVVQRQINTEIGPENVSPHDMFFKNLKRKTGYDIADNDSRDETDVTESHKQNDDVDYHTVNTNSVESQNCESLNIVIKEETKEFEDINAISKDITNYVIISNGGVSFPNFAKIKR